MPSSSPLFKWHLNSEPFNDRTVFDHLNSGQVRYWKHFWYWYWLMYYGPLHFYSSKYVKNWTGQIDKIFCAGMILRSPGLQICIHFQNRWFRLGTFAMNCSKSGKNNDAHSSFVFIFYFFTFKIWIAFYRALF